MPAAAVGRRQARPTGWRVEERSELVYLCHRAHDPPSFRPRGIGDPALRLPAGSSRSVIFLDIWEARSAADLHVRAAGPVAWRSRQIWSFCATAFRATFCPHPRARQARGRRAIIEARDHTRGEPRIADLQAGANAEAPRSARAVLRTQRRSPSVARSRAPAAGSRPARRRRRSHRMGSAWRRTARRCCRRRPPGRSSRR